MKCMNNGLKIHNQYIKYKKITSFSVMDLDFRNQLPPTGGVQKILLDMKVIYDGMTVQALVRSYQICRFII